MGAQSTQILDFRSDTVTQPSAAMREAMMAAPLGDDVFGDDPSVLALEVAVAQRLGKTAAVFVPSGTMANQLAIAAQCNRGEEIVAHARCHIFNYEGGAASALTGVTIRPIESEDGSLPLEAFRQALHLTDDPHCAPSTMVTLENTNNACGGTVIPQQHLHALTALAKSLGLRCHLDGARLWNAEVRAGVSAREMAAGFDSVSVCFSKGLGAPAGSVLAASERIVAKARRFRKMFGGGMRQSGLLAAACHFALENNVARLESDHRRAHQLAETLAKIPGVFVKIETVQTNLVYFQLARDHRVFGVESGAVKLVELARNHGLRITGDGERFRMVTHLDIDDTAVQRSLDILAKILN